MYTITFEYVCMYVLYSNTVFKYVLYSNVYVLSTVCTVFEYVLYSNTVCTVYYVLYSNTYMYCIRIYIYVLSMDSTVLYSCTVQCITVYR